MVALLRFHFEIIVMQTFALHPENLQQLCFSAAFQPFENKQFMRMAHNGEQERVLPKVHQHNSERFLCVVCQQHAAVLRSALLA